jgi:hypothetical protein
MKKSYFLPMFILAVGGLSLQNSAEFNYSNLHAERNGGGASPGRTGAPGETNCTACHSGSVLDGTSENILTVLDGSTPITEYTPGSVYTVSLSMASNPAKKGFQSTALDGTDAMAGSFLAGTTTTISGTSVKYANHNSSSNTSATSSWTWTWSAPVTNVGDVTFYVAANKANGNNNVTGDEIYLSQHTIAAPTGAGVEESASPVSGLSLGFDPVNSKLKLKFNTLISGEMTLNLLDINGKVVMNKEIGTSMIGKNDQSVQLPSDLKNGIYVVHLLVNNNTISGKIMINK